MFIAVVLFKSGGINILGFKIYDLGLVEFKEAWQFQKKTFKDVRDSSCPAHSLILCQHYPVITLGRRADKKNILVSKDELGAKGIGIYETERGGDVTYHGPGQLVAYPVFNLNYLKKDIHWFLRQLEEAVILFLSDYGIKGQRQPGFTGVWVNPVRDGASNAVSRQQKIASIGIAVRNWVTFHGLSINIKKEALPNFKFIRPCGMEIEIGALETFLQHRKVYNNSPIPPPDPAQNAGSKRLGLRKSPKIGDKKSSRQGGIFLNTDIEFEDIKQNLIRKFNSIFFAKAIGGKMIKVVLPELGEGIEKATVSYWYFKAGEKVSQKDDLVELATDKATFNLPSPVSGVISEVLFSEGDTANIGETLAIIEEQKEG